MEILTEKYKEDREETYRNDSEPSQLPVPVIPRVTVQRCIVYLVLVYMETMKRSINPKVNEHKTYFHLYHTN